MADLLSAFNGAIPVGALRSRVFHNRVNKLVQEKKKKNTVVKGGESIKIDDLSDVPAEKKKLDEPTPEVVKIETTQEVVDEKPKRKYRRRKSSTKK